MPEVLSPFVYWAQTESNLTLKVDLKDVKNPDVQLENKKLQFGAQGYGARGLNKYAFTLDFHSAIDPEESHYKVYDRNVDFTLKKKESGWWPRITGMPQKPAWLKIDFDRWKSEEDVEDDDESRDIMEDYPNMYNKLEKEELGYKRDSIEGTYEAVGGPMKFCQLMQFLEVMHPMFGYTKGGFVIPLLQVVHISRQLSPRMTHSADSCYANAGFAYLLPDTPTHTLNTLPDSLVENQELRTLSLTSANQVLGRNIILFCMIDAEPRMHTKPVIFYLFLIWSIVELVRYASPAPHTLNDMD
ncbi:unnamed protein product [Timema podura]|uniref:very-long-chain (3R)-3-hydroxyacyl-CoA dehydratase n=1 Tax=Timema podura TaxID=61482 RepID=A0ABN7NI87_TIMPD|nr:unnamed protein product [Timema podura]